MIKHALCVKEKKNEIRFFLCILLFSNLRFSFQVTCLFFKLKVVASLFTLNLKTAYSVLTA